MTGSSGKYIPPERYVNDSGRTLTSREFWELIRRYGEAGAETSLVHDGPGLADATIDPDGTWWRPERMTAEELARLKDRHRQEHEGRCEWTRHGVTRRELADGTTELTLEGSRYPTRAERRAGTRPVICATEPCATRVTPTPRDGTVESSAAYAMVQEHCGAPYTVMWRGRGWTVELSSAQ
jgi:hypothetical protein